MSRRLAAAALMLPASVGVWHLGRAHPVDLSPGLPVERVLAEVPDGTLVRLLPGTYPPLTIARPLTVTGGPGVVVRGPIVVTSDGVRLSGLRVEGGESGISVRDADDVQIRNVTVWGAELRGIEVSNGSVELKGCVIGGLTSPYAQGFAIRNSTGHPRSVVEGCRVTSGREGLVSHVSRVEFLDNEVSGTSLRAVTVAEMSEGLVEGNRVHKVRGIGLYCGDMSHCEIRANVVRDVDAGRPDITSEAGYGVVAWYHSTARLADNRFADLAAPRPVRVALGSVSTDRSPLVIWPPGWRGALPGVWVSAAALAGLLAAAGAARRVVRRRRRFGPGVPGRALAILAGGFLVQSFHMIEHVSQVAQAFVLDAEHHSGLLGSAFDTEWVHFAYNLAVLAFLAWALVVAWRTAPHTGADGALTLLVGTFGIQSYHMVEHTVRIVQHLSLGLNPAPGILGLKLNLIWLHFGLNLAVYAGFAAALFLLVRPPVVSWMGRIRADTSVPAAGQPQPA